MWQVQCHWLDSKHPVICSSHTNRGVNKVGLRKLDAVWLAILGNHLGGYVLRRPPIVPQWSQLLQISRVSTTLGCCQCKSLGRWPLSFTMWPKQEWPASILHKLDAAKGHSSLMRNAPRETSQGVRNLLGLPGLLQVPGAFSSSI